jgi:hypothetical protein
MNWKECGRKQSMYYPGKCMEELENMKNLSRSPGWDLNLGPPKYKADVLTT